MSHFRIKSFGEFKDLEQGPVEELDPAVLEGIKTELREIMPEMERIYQELHENPELGGEEVETGKRIAARLQEMGVEILKEGINGGGLIAIVRGKEGGPTIALRADMDALPIQERAENSPRSKKDGVAHMCGHDIHTASLLGAAHIFKDLAAQEKLDGDVVLVFQPSEEKAHQKASGASRMVARLLQMGYMGEGGKIDAFFGAHVMREMPRGTINVREGVQLASSGEVDIKLKTKGGHIMNAFEVPNLHLIFSEITLRLSEVFKPLYEKREALVASARTAYGGTGYNVLPAEAKATWVVRITSEMWSQMAPEIYSKMQNVVREVVQKHAQLGDVQIEITPEVGYLPIIHTDPNLVRIAEASSKHMIDGAHNTRTLSMAGEDFSHYLVENRGRAIPGVFVMVGGANPEKGIPTGSHHTPDFRVDPESMRDIAGMHAAFALNAMKYLKDKKN